MKFADSAEIRVVDRTLPPQESINGLACETSENSGPGLTRKGELAVDG